MTKKAQRARKAAWTAALRDGRVLRVNQTTHTSYPTVAARDLAIADLLFSENEIEIITEDEVGQVRIGTVQSDGEISWRNK